MVKNREISLVISVFARFSLCVFLQTLYLRSPNCCSRSTKHYILATKIDTDFATATAFEPSPSSFSVLVLLAVPISFSRHESVRSILSAPIPHKTCASISRKYPQACYLRQHLVNPSHATLKVQTFEKQSKKKFAYKKCFLFSRLLALCLKWFSSTWLQTWGFPYLQPAWLFQYYTTQRYDISTKISSAAHETSTLYKRNLKYTQKI